MNTKEMTYTEKRFGQWICDKEAGSLRAKSGSYGGGSEAIAMQKGGDDMNGSKTIVRRLTPI